MKVIVNDDDIIKLIVEYLQSRDLYHSAESTQAEAEVIPDEPQDVLLTLKKFIFQGRLLDTRQYLKPFFDLYKENFPTKKLLPILFRQQFCEVCFDDKKKDSMMLQDTTKEMEGLFSEDEFSEMVSSVRDYWQSLCERNSSTTSIQRMSRKDTFDDIATLISPFLPSQTGRASKPGNRLVYLLIKGLLYDQCAWYCRGKATGEIPSTGLVKGTTLHNRMTDPSPPDAALYYWIASIKDDDVFTREHSYEDLQVVNSMWNIRSSQSGILESQSNGVTSNEATTSIDKHLPDDSSHPPETKKSQVGSKTSTKQATNRSVHFKNTQDENPPPTNEGCSPLDVKVSTDPNKPSGHQTASSDLPVQDNSSIVKADHPKPTRNESQQPESTKIGSTSPNDIPVQVRDSYSNYVAERETARENYNKFMEEIKQKEDRANALRRNLMEGTTQDKEDAPRNTPPSSTASPSVNPLFGNDLSVTQKPNLFVNIGRSSVASPLSAVTSPLVGEQGGDPKARPLTGYVRPGNQTTKLNSRSSRERQHGLEHSYHPLEKTEDLAAIRAVAFHPRGAAFAVGSNSHVLKLCAVPKRALAPQPRNTKTRSPDWMQLIMKKSQVHQGSIYSLSWNEQGNILATCSNDKLIKIFNYDHDTQVLQGPQYHLGHHDGVIRDVTFMMGYNNGSMLASGGGSDFVVYTYACDVDTVVHQLSGHSDQVLSLYSWSNGLLASSSQDRSVRLWDLRTARCISVLGFGSTSDQHAITTSVCVDGTGNCLAVGRDDNLVSLYDMKAGKSVSEFTVHSGEVRSVRFHPTKSNLLLSSSYDGSAVITDTTAIHADLDANASASSFKCCHHKDKVIQSRWHPNGTSFATTSADQSCVLWGARDL